MNSYCTIVSRYLYDCACHENFYFFRGLPGAKPVPFRRWYGNLGELRSVFTSTNFVVCTATATVATKEKIFNILSLTKSNTFEIELSPDRKNLCYSKQYIDNNTTLGDVLHEII